MRSLWNDFLDPSEVGRFHGKPVTREIRATLGLLDEEPEKINAEDPLPEDTVAIVEEYEIGPGDTVEITIHELLRAGSITTETRRVSELGNVSLPIVGTVNLNGLTERQAEDLIKSKLKPDIMPDPIATVVVRQRTQRMFTMVGYISRPGPVEIPRPDFRMLEALSYIGSIPEEVEKVYVIRKTETQPKGVPSTETAPSGEGESPRGDSPPPAPAEAAGSSASGHLREDIDLLLSDGILASATTGRPGRSTQAATTTSASQTGKLTTQEQRELLEAVQPSGTSSAAASGASSTQAGTDRASTAPSAQGEKSLSKWLWLNGDWVEVRGDREPAQPKEAPAAPATTPSIPTEEKPTTSWEALAEGSEETRIIQIPLEALQAGESRYNIVIRPWDVITIPTPEAGRRYYVNGHVRGPGAFTIPVEGITLKAAIAAAGGLDQFAWPSRCEIIRRIGPDQEEVHQVDLDRIFAMKDDGIKIKPGDIINVGTHPLVPFMVTIANGFRVAYGFGFVYDRNFGTIDSYGGQQNPDERRRAEQRTRFPQILSAFPGL